MINGERPTAAGNERVRVHASAGQHSARTAGSEEAISNLVEQAGGDDPNLALGTSDARLRLILESATDFAIITTDLQGRVAGWNVGARNILGWEEADVLGCSAELMWTPEDRAAGEPESEMRTTREPGRAADERWHLKRDGSRFWARGEMMPMRSDTGTLLGYLKILRDRTGQRAAETALRESENRFRMLAEGIPNSCSGRAARVSAPGAARSGSPTAPCRKKKASVWAGSTLSTLTTGRQQWRPGPKWKAVVSFLSSTARSVRRTARIAGSKAVPVRDGQGRIVEWLGTSTDIDDQVQAREVLARSREELEALVAERTHDLAHALGALRTEATERARAEEAQRRGRSWKPWVS